MSSIAFTVVIPVHNGANYIAEAIHSLLRQSYPPTQIIILENHSTDDTLRILSGFADSRIRVVPSARLLSIEENWARILDQPLTAYFTFMGHDDVLYPDFFAHMAALIAQEPGASLYQAGIDQIDAAGRLVRHQITPPPTSSAEAFLRAVLAEQEEVCGTGYVMSAEGYRRVGGIPPLTSLLYADVILWYRLAALSYRACTPTPLVGYRVHDQNTHQRINPIVYFEALTAFSDFLRSTELYRQEPNTIERYRIALFQRVCRRAARQAAYADADSAALLNRLETVIARAGREQQLTLTDGPARLYLQVARAPAVIRHLARTFISGASDLTRLIRR